MILTEHIHLSYRLWRDTMHKFRFDQCCYAVKCAGKRMGDVGDSSGVESRAFDGLDQFGTIHLLRLELDHGPPLLQRHLRSCHTGQRGQYPGDAFHATAAGHPRHAKGLSVWRHGGQDSGIGIQDSGFRERPSRHGAWPMA